MTIGIVGKPYRHYLDYLHNQSEIEVVAFHDVRETFAYPAWVSKIYALDFSSKLALHQGLQTLVQHDWAGAAPVVDGLEATYESGILPKVWLAEFFHCPATSEASASAATDKTLMRQRFFDYDPAITPQFQAVTTWDEVNEFAQRHQFPLILKPANLMKSLLVTKNDTLAQLQENFAVASQTIGQLYQEYGVFHRQPQLIVEEFLDGPSFSVDAIADSQGNVTCLPVVDLVMARELGIPDNYNYSRALPSELDESTAQAIQRVARAGVRALDLRNSAAHVELVLTKHGPKLIEIGARFGGYRPRMYELSYGLNVHALMVGIAVGNPPDVQLTTRQYSKVYELFPSTTGAFSGLQNAPQLQQLASFHSLTQRAQIGEKVGLSKDGYKFCSAVILHHADEHQFAQDCQFIEQQVRVLTKVDPAPSFSTAA